MANLEVSKSEELVQASFQGQHELVRSLVEAEVDINEMGRIWNPLHAAIENGHINVITYLLASGADIEYLCSGMRPLHHAIDLEIDAAAQADESDDPEPALTRLLLDAGADINGKDTSGMTPLQMAVARGHKKAERLLRSRGAA
jgi:ankyrin repeat protein